MKQRHTLPSWVSPVIGVLFLLCIAVTLFTSMRDRPVSDEAVAKAHQAVMRAAVQCFALEGAYPASLKYLEENYSLLIDHDRFSVVFDTFGSNVPPDVRIIPVGKGAEPG